MLSLEEHEKSFITSGPGAGDVLVVALPNNFYEQTQ